MIIAECCARVLWDCRANGREEYAPEKAVDIGYNCCI